MSQKKHQGYQEICHDDQLLACVLKADYHSDGIEFFTPPEFSQQLGYMNRGKGYVIDPHVHNEVVREVKYTKEALIIRRGRVRVDFYTEEQRYIGSTELGSGDIILLAYGGHGFEMLEDTEIVEIKQGPYAGDGDKTRFESTVNNLSMLD